MLGVIVIVGIFLLLVAAFGTARDAGLVMLNLPLALIGGVAGVWAVSGTLTIAAVIGFITLFGIATRNGVILIDHITRLIRLDGMMPEEAVRRGAEERLVSMLMTALATALALVPPALAGGESGSEIQAPMVATLEFHGAEHARGAGDAPAIRRAGVAVSMDYLCGVHDPHTNADAPL